MLSIFGQLESIPFALHGLDDRLAPSAEADNCGIYHGRNRPHG
jgi:hypothetical protein